MSTKSAIADATRLNAFAMEPEKVVIIGLDTDDGPKHELYDKRVKLALHEGTVQNMYKWGWTHGAIDVRKNGDAFEALVGRQRVRCAREANRRRVDNGLEPFKIRVFVKQCKDAADALGIIIGENALRQDVGLLDKAEDCKRYMDLGRSEEEAAVVFGVGVQTIKNWMRLFDLAPAVRKAVDAGQLTASAAAKLADLSREEQAVELEKLIAAGPVTVAETARAIRQARTGEERALPPKKKVIKRVIAEHKRLGEKSPLDAEFIRGVRWMMGELPSKAIGGITAMSEAEAAE